eukprot:2316492-Prymnesium_polylepis.1
MEGVVEEDEEAAAAGDACAETDSVGGGGGGGCFRPIVPPARLNELSSSARSDEMGYAHRLWHQLDERFMKPVFGGRP